MRRRRSLLAVAMVSTAVLGIGLLAGTAQAGGTPRYKVTIVNLTHGQPFTPPVIATHSWNFNLFRAGDLASVGIMQVAENGNVPSLVSSLQQATSVADVVAGDAPLVPSGLPGSAAGDYRATFEFDVTDGARFISLASMLICTNDGFTGINHVRLPQGLGSTVRRSAVAYDAGTEVNTEDFGDIVPPCQGLVGVTGVDPGTGVSDPLLLEGGVIQQHPGISGGIDLVPSVHGWNEPVLRVFITRIA